MQLVLQVDVRGGDEDVDAAGAAPSRRASQRARRCRARCARARPQTIGACDLRGDRLDGLEVAVARRGKPASMTSTPRRSSWRAIPASPRCSSSRPATARRRAGWCRRFELRLYRALPCPILSRRGRTETTRELAQPTSTPTSRNDNATGLLRAPVAGSAERRASLSSDGESSYAAGARSAHLRESPARADPRPAWHRTEFIVRG